MIHDGRIVFYSPFVYMGFVCVCSKWSCMSFVWGLLCVFFMTSVLSCCLWCVLVCHDMQSQSSALRRHTENSPFTHSYYFVILSLFSVKILQTLKYYSLVSKYNDLQCKVLLYQNEDCLRLKLSLMLRFSNPDVLENVCSYRHIWQCCLQVPFWQSLLVVLEDSTLIEVCLKLNKVKTLSTAKPKEKTPN